jgi:uncharacterized membrane protein YgcG
VDWTNLDALLAFAQGQEVRTRVAQQSEQHATVNFVHTPRPKIAKKQNRPMARRAATCRDCGLSITGDFRDHKTSGECERIAGARVAKYEGEKHNRFNPGGGRGGGAGGRGGSRGGGRGGGGGRGHA